jgi:heme exporter protein A
MHKVSVCAKDVKKVFGRRIIFDLIRFDLVEGESLAITGPNGSGKSTLVKIIAGVLSPTSGNIEIAIDDRVIKSEDLYQNVGLVSPYLQLYEEFSGLENLRLAADIRGISNTGEELSDLLSRVSLFHRRNDEVRAYSSGMKQRLKYAFALSHSPSVLILDEPTSNLDVEGLSMVRSIIEEQRKRGIIVLATNDKADIQFCNKVIDLASKSS